MHDFNLMLASDSYKYSHAGQYPPGTEIVSSYLESRGGMFPETTVIGPQLIIKKYLVGQVVTAAKIDEAEAVINAHMGPGTFNRAGWEHILTVHNGHLPIIIRAVPEGTTHPTGTVLMSIENTDPKCYWLTNFLETLISQVWYPITVATQSREMKKLIGRYMAETGGSIAGLEFKLHDFGFRGVSSTESAAIGGLAHLVNFKGTDTVQALVAARDYYSEPMAGFSIPASEHSTITSWGRSNELDAYRNMLELYPSGLMACVSDSYDIFKACEMWGGPLNDMVLARDGVLVIRPDSGDPPTVLLKMLNILGDKFGYTTNFLGYKLLNPKVRIIQGDGVDYAMVGRVLETLKINGWAADNLAFGSGGALLQKMNRDTQKFAIKASWIQVNGEGRDVYKEPITAEFKKSKRGRFNTLPIVFENGKLVREQTLAEIRALAAI